MTEIKNTSLLNMITGAVGLAALFATLIYGGAGLSITLAVGGMVFFFEYLFNFRKERIFTPYLLMATAPLLLLKYSSLFDFRLRILCLILLIYIVSIACAGKARKLEFSLLQTNGFKIWLIAFLLFCLVSTVLYLRGIHLSGDEPHYLMIAQSLADDGDFDLKNNFTEKAYLSYIPVELRFHGGIYGGRYLSFHLPGLSFLLVPFYWLFKLLGGAVPAALYFRLVASFFNAFFVLMLFHIMRMSFPGRDITGLWLLVTAIFPLAFHSVHLYPELPAATCMMAAYYTAFSRRRNLLLAGLFLSFIPWLHVKYIPPLLVLALAIVYDNVKPLKPFRIDKEKLKRLMRFLLFPLINFILLTVFCMVLYNTLSPTNIFPKESYWTVPFLLRLKVFFAYFIDQRDGLLLYAPLYFLVFWSFKKRFQGKLLLLGIGFSYVFFHAFTSVRGAYSPAGRPLMFVSWIFVLFIAHYYFNILNPSVDETNHLPGDRENHLQADGQKHLPVDGENHHSADGQKYLPVDGANHPAASGASDKNWQRFFYRLLLGTSLAVPLWFLYYPFFMYQPVFSYTAERASGLNMFLGSSDMELWKLFPAFNTKTGSGHLANWIWVGVLIGALLIYYFRPFKKFKLSFAGKGREITALCLFVLFGYLYCFHPHVHLIDRGKFMGKGISFFKTSRNFIYLEPEKVFRIKGGQFYDIFIHRDMTRKSKVILNFKETDVVSVTVRHGKRVLFQSKGHASEMYQLPITKLSSIHVDGKRISHLGIETRTSKKNGFLYMEIK